MEPLLETAEYLDYSLGGGALLVRLMKTSPPVVIFTYDMSKPENAGRPQTWEEFKTQILDVL